MCLLSTSIEAHGMRLSRCPAHILAHLKSYRPDLNRWPHPYQGCALPAELLQLLPLLKHVAVFRFPPCYFQSGRRGSNPPPIAWKAIALPNELLPLLCRFVGESGLEPLNSEEDRFTVCCNCRYATPPIPIISCEIRADEGTRTPDRLITNQLLYQLSYIGFSAFQTTLFLILSLQRYKLLFIHQIFWVK